MKKLLLMGAFLLCSSLSMADAAEKIRNVRDLDANCNGIYEEGEVNPCGEYRTGPCVCYCPVTKFKPKYYCEKRCIEEPYCVQKKCTRYVPQYYTKQCCRYVPQYYTKTYCRQVPECYYVTENKIRKRYVTERKCRYEPYTCIEKCCVDEPVCGQGGCPSGSCPVPAQYAKPAGAEHYDNQNQSVKNGMKNGNQNMNSSGGNQNMNRNGMRQNSK